MSSHKRGVVIIISLSMTLILMILGMTFLTTSGGDYFIASRQKNITSAFYLAIAGIEYAYRESSEWTFPHSESIKLSTGSCFIEATIESDSGNIEVVATGKMGKFEKVVRTTISGGAVIRWREN